MPKTLLHVFPTFVAAGSQQRTVQLIRAFGDSYRHRVVALDGKLEALDLLPPEIDATPASPPATGGWMSGVRALRTLLKQERPDLLLTYNWGSFDAVLAARMQGLRAHVHHEDGFNMDEAQRQKQRRVLARRTFLRAAYRVVMPSQKLADIARNVWRLPPERVQRISNGVHLDRFTPKAPSEAESGAAMRARHGIPLDALVVGAVGHLRPVKNYERLFGACARLAPTLARRGVHLLLLGNGPERQKLERAAQGLVPPGGQVHFAGHQTDLPPYYRAMDVFAISSDSEQQPVSLLEAMAVGVAPVATDVGDVRTCMGPASAAHLTPLSDPEPETHLARSIEALLLDDDLRRELGKAASERARELYSFETMLDTYRELYEGAAAL
ncbi:MAG: glycosyltransferase involved in cell wall biosynthesis [Chlamydiales bacterium]|jgi:glycosyltransferase involved in cell wall biosynthesis